MNANNNVLVAMSGGVDSSATASLLLSQGYNCIGANMRLYEHHEPILNVKSCCSLSDADQAAAVCARLHIPFYVLNCKQEFGKEVIDRFIAEYLAGRTPNPCIDCNRHLKFSVLLEHAGKLDCQFLATGHYARIRFNEDSSRFELLKGVDETRDQSYVLYMLTQEQLSRTLFPLGELHKTDVRDKAKTAGLINADKPDSQDICFVLGGDYASFIEERTGTASPPGDFIDENGTVLGRHKGYIHYTIGQRKGLGISSTEPYFVTEIRPEDNTVVLGRKKDVMADRLTATRFNWLSVACPENTPLRCKAKIRYRYLEADCTVHATSNDCAEVIFDEPQSAITKGQAVVLYDGDRVLGGGTIS